MDNKTPNDIVDPTPELPKKSFGQKVVGAITSRPGKFALAGLGTAGALFGTYVLGFRQGQDNVIEVLATADPDETEDSDLELEVTVDVEDPESND